MLEFTVTGEGRLVPHTLVFQLLWRTNTMYAENEIVQVKWIDVFSSYKTYIVLVCTIVTISSSQNFGVHSVGSFLHAYMCIVKD